MTSGNTENELLYNKAVILTDSDVSVLFKPDDSKVIEESGSNKRNLNNDDKEVGGWTLTLVLACTICCLSSAVPSGYNIGVVNSAADVMKRFCKKSIKERYDVTITSENLDLLWSSLVSIFLIGGVTGSLNSSLLANSLGRRGALVIGNIFGLIGAIMFFLIPILNSIELFFFGRLIVGLSGGLATSLLPTYLTEIAPLKLRGAVGVLCQLGIFCGVLLGQIAALHNVLGTNEHWHYMLSVFSPLCLFGLLLTYYFPESPKYLLVLKEQREKALQALCRLRNVDRTLLKNEIINLEKELASKSTNNTWTITKVIKEPMLRLPLILVCLLQFGQQLSGVNAVFYYSNVIFEEAKLDLHTAQLATIGTGVINIGMALVSVYLMSYFRRRTLVFVSSYLTISSLIILCISIAFINLAFMKWVCMGAVLSFVLFYGIALGPVPFFIGSELFDVGPRSAAMSLGSMCNWGGNFIVGMTFPLMDKFLKYYSFLIFAVCILFLALFCRKYLPETRGKTTTEIAQLVNQGFKSRPNKKNSGNSIT